jgi:hypothetical protein
MLLVLRSQFESIFVDALAGSHRVLPYLMFRDWVSNEFDVFLAGSRWEKVFCHMFCVVSLAIDLLRSSAGSFKIFIGS